MVALNKANLTRHIQRVIELHYLKPMNGSDKANLKDGYIERKLHGGMHVSRAVFWAGMLHKFLLRHAPVYVNQALAAIGKHINVDSDTVLLLIQVTMACHDAARKSEGYDRWEGESADVAKQFLIELGLDEKYAAIFAASIKFKDKPEEYEEALISSGIATSQTSEFDYIRQLVNLGDNLDLMRCVGSFRVKYIFDTLKFVDGYNIEDNRAEVIQLMKAIHQFIYDQQDMLFACSLVDEDDVIIAALPAKFSETEKVKYEHAGNVFEAIYAKAATNKEFQSYLPDHVISSPELATVSPAFDPYVHGTNSSIFAILPKTNFQLMSPLIMMDEYYAAPLAGELTQGGYRAVGTFPQKNGNTGRPAFGKLSAGLACESDDFNHYTLDKIIRRYTGEGKSTERRAINEFRAECRLARETLFSRINIMNILLARVRELSNIPLSSIISSEEVASLDRDMNATIEFYWFIQLFGTHIFPNFKLIDGDESKRKDISAAIDSLITYERITAKIKDQNLNVRSIVENPTQENLQAALRLLELPTSLQTSLGCYSHEVRNVELPATQLFCLEENYPAMEMWQREKPRYAFYALAENDSPSYNIGIFLADLVCGNESYDLFREMAVIAQNHILALQEKFALFRKLVLAPAEKFALNNELMHFINEPFPVIFVVDAGNDKVQLFNFQSQEYRSEYPLIVGEDITLIATDTHAHRKEIVNYLHQYNRDNIEVVLFDDLKLSRESKKRPVLSVQPEVSMDVIPVPEPASPPTSLFAHSYFTRRQPLEELHQQHNLVTKQGDAEGSMRRLL